MMSMFSASRSATALAKQYFGVWTGGAEGSDIGEPVVERGLQRGDRLAGGRGLDVLEARAGDRELAAGARVIHERRRGYGQAYLRGFSEARGEYIVMGDSDDTYDFSDLDALL